MISCLVMIRGEIPATDAKEECCIPDAKEDCCIPKEVEDDEFDRGLFEYEGNILIL